MGPSKCLKQIIQIGLKSGKNPNRLEANQLAIIVQAWPTIILISRLQWTNSGSGQSGTWSLGLRIASPAL